MFEKEIEFSAHELIINAGENFPKPIKVNIPQWFKNLKHDYEHFTVKGCMPFLDSLTTGYVLYIYQDIRLKHNVTDPEGCPHSIFMETSVKKSQLFDKGTCDFININSENVVHSQLQLEGSPINEKNKNCKISKIMNPWRIKTPPGYSCLFVPPLNNTDDRFSIIPGVVDTDTFQNEINFPFIVNGDKYESLDTVIQKGTPYVQVIPFKRDNWKMSIKHNSAEDQKKMNVGKYKLSTLLLNSYKKLYWNKKSWN